MDLLVVRLQGVEGVEQLFLHRLLARQKLHVVDEQHVYPAVAVAEARLPVSVVALAAEDGVDQLVDELFAGYNE